jgi:hypothetical protein
MLQELSDFFPAVKHAEALVKFTRAVSGVWGSGVAVPITEWRIMNNE